MALDGQPPVNNQNQGSNCKQSRSINHTKRLLCSPLITHYLNRRCITTTTAAVYISRSSENPDFHQEMNQCTPYSCNQRNLLHYLNQWQHHRCLINCQHCLRQIYNPRGYLPLQMLPLNHLISIVINCLFNLKTTFNQIHSKITLK